VHFIFAGCSYEKLVGALLFQQSGLGNGI
jgi:hypothetical protein